MLRFAVTPTATIAAGDNSAGEHRSLVPGTVVLQDQTARPPTPIVAPSPASVTAQRDTLTGHETELRAAEQRYQLPYYVLTALALRECAYADCGAGTHNAWGLGPGLRYATWEDGIEAAASNLRYWIDRRGSLSGALCTWLDGQFPCTAEAAAYAGDVIWLMGPR